MEERVYPAKCSTPSRSQSEVESIINNSGNVTSADSSLISCSSSCNSTMTSIRLSRSRKLSSHSVVISSSRLRYIEKLLRRKEFAAKKIQHFVRFILIRRAALAKIYSFLITFYPLYRHHRRERRYLQNYRWNYHQADRVWALCMGWKTRHFLRSSECKQRSSIYLDLLRVCLSAIGYYHNSNKLLNTETVRLLESSFLLFIKGQHRKLRKLQISHAELLSTNSAPELSLSDADKLFFSLTVRELHNSKQHFMLLASHKQLFFSSASNRPMPHVHKSSATCETVSDVIQKPPSLNFFIPNETIALEASEVMDQVDISAHHSSSPPASTPVMAGLLNSGLPPLTDAESNVVTAAIPFSVEGVEGVPKEEKPDTEVTPNRRQAARFAGRRLRIARLSQQLQQLSETTLALLHSTPSRESGIGEENQSGVTDPAVLSPTPSLSPPRSSRSTPVTSPLARKWVGKFPQGLSFPHNHLTTAGSAAESKPKQFMSESLIEEVREGGRSGDISGKSMMLESLLTDLSSSHVSTSQSTDVS